MKKTICILLLFVELVSCQSKRNILAEQKDTLLQTTDEWKLVWADEFNQKGNSFDTSKWKFEAKGEAPWNKYMVQSSEQAYVQNGKLILRAERKNGKYITGGISTQGKMSFKYGKLEIYAKFNSFQGGWPAIWLMPVKRQYPNPAGKNEYPGEIDIMEQVSLEKVVWHTVHSHYTLDLKLDKNPARAGSGTFKENEFNLYTLEWTPTELTFFINGEKTFCYPNLQLDNETEMKQWPFDVPYYLIVNYAVGGEGTWPGKINDTGLPGIMEIEYARYFQKKHTYA